MAHRHSARCTADLRTPLHTLDARALTLAMRALETRALETRALETRALEARALEARALEARALETRALEARASRRLTTRGGSRLDAHGARARVTGRPMTSAGPMPGACER